MKFSRKKPIGISIFLGFVILFAILSPLIFSKLSAVVTFPDYADELGSIFGIMSPFIAIAAVIATFAAFWVQYSANQEMLRNNEKMQIERQFYEMLKIHTENRNNLTFQKWKLSGTEKSVPNLANPNGFSDETSKYEIIELKGHEAIEYYLKEFETIDNMLEIYSREFEKRNSQSLIKISRKRWLQRVYIIFYYGLEAVLWKQELYSYNEKLFKFQYEELMKGKKVCGDKETEGNINDMYKPLFKTMCFEGHASQLGHYYRHLFLLVKYIVGIDSSLYSSEEEAYSVKRNYLRILRAQLSNTEQLLLFYNWLSDHGQRWECTENHFFTDYRMIHNIWPNTKNRYDQKSLRNLFPKHIKGDGPMFEFEERKR